MIATRTQKKTAGISDLAVEKATGHTWAGWLRLLDLVGGRKMTHKEIAAHLYREQKLPSWWAQMVTVGYEQARGLRLPGEKPGGFDISKSRTFPAPASRCFAAWKDAAQRSAWLKERGLRVRTATANKSMRLTWSDGKTIVSVNFHPKSRAKCQIVVDHTRLPDAKAAEKMKKHWALALGRLADYLERT